MQPHRRQPTRLPHPWDSPGKNTGVGCHFLLQCMKVKSESEVTQSYPTLATPGTAAHQAPLSMGFSRQKYWSGVPLPSPLRMLVWLYMSIIFWRAFGTVKEKKASIRIHNFNSEIVSFNSMHKFTRHKIHSSINGTAKELASLRLLLSRFSRCPTLCNPIDSSPPGFPVPGILQARTMEWVVISFSNAWKWKMKVKSLSRVRLLATPWTAAYQAPPSTGFSRPEYWSGVPLPSLSISNIH